MTEAVDDEESSQGRLALIPEADRGRIMAALERVCAGAMREAEELGEASQKVGEVDFRARGESARVSLSVIAGGGRSATGVWLVGCVRCGPEGALVAEAVADYEVSWSPEVADRPGDEPASVARKLWSLALADALGDVAASEGVLMRAESKAMAEACGRSGLDKKAAPRL